MKQLLNDSMPIYIPDWAKYLAIDGDGQVCVYQNKPYFIPGIWGTWETNDNYDNFEYLYKTLPPKDASKEYYILEWVYI